MISRSSISSPNMDLYEILVCDRYPILVLHEFRRIQVHVLISCGCFVKTLFDVGYMESQQFQPEKNKLIVALNDSVIKFEYAQFDQQGSQVIFLDRSTGRVLNSNENNQPCMIIFSSIRSEQPSFIYFLIFDLV